LSPPFLTHGAVLFFRTSLPFFLFFACEPGLALFSFSLNTRNGPRLFLQVKASARPTTYPFSFFANTHWWNPFVLQFSLQGRLCNLLYLFLFTRPPPFALFPWAVFVVREFSRGTPPAGLPVARLFFIFAPLMVGPKLEFFLL